MLSRTSSRAVVGKLSDCSSKTIYIALLNALDPGTSCNREGLGKAVMQAIVAQTSQERTRQTYRLFSTRILGRL